MQVNNHIIIVAPKQYKDLARRLSHEISKKPGFNGAFWTINKYEENEFQLGGNRYVILIGNPDENRITEGFLPLIKAIQNQAGACYGFDGSKAVVFGEGKLEQGKDFKEVLKKSAAITAGAGSSVGAAIAASSIIFWPIWWIINPLYLGYVLVTFFQRKARESKLRAEQTKAALTFFLADHFDAWVGIKKQGQAE